MKFTFIHIKLDVENLEFWFSNERLGPNKIGMFSYWIKISSFFTSDLMWISVIWYLNTISCAINLNK